MHKGTATYLLYHVVFSTKKRDKIILLANRQRLYQYIAGVIKQKAGLPILINGTDDHVHILAFLPNHISVSEMIQAIKGSSSYWYNKEIAGHARHLYWQDGYSIYTVSPTLIEKVKNYIFHQDEHHLVMDYEKEIDSFEQELRKYYNPEAWETDAPGS